MRGVRRGVFTAAIPLALVLASSVPAGASSGGTNCSLGRSLLDCKEKVALYYDSVNWAIGGVGALGLFQAPRPLHLHNPALAQFWRFEAATGLTRYTFEFGIGNQGVDQDFEEVAPAAHLPRPVIKPTGIVTRHMASVMSQLLQTEQQEVVNLLVMDTALNRATYALQDSRPDWSRYQTYIAAGFARRAAGAISALIPRQRAVTTALVGRKLMFGVGSADQRAAQRYVRKHGFPRPLQQIMLRLGMNQVTLAFIKSGFVHAKPGPVTYSMSKYLSSRSVIAREKQCASALRHFANRIPAVPQPA